MQGAKAEVQAFPDRVVLEVSAQAPTNEGAVSVALFEATPAGDVLIAQAGSASLWVHLPIPRPGTYFAEITDARGNKFRTQKVPVEQGFFDLAAQRGKKEREFKAQADAKRKLASADAAARAVAASSAAEAARAVQTHRHGLVVGGILGALMVAGLVVLYLFVRSS